MDKLVELVGLFPKEAQEEILNALETLGRHRFFQFLSSTVRLSAVQAVITTQTDAEIARNILAAIRVEEVLMSLQSEAAKLGTNSSDDQET